MAAVHPTIDVGIGIPYLLKHFISDEPLSAAQLTLTAERPRQGEKIFTFAYAKTTVQNSPTPSIFLNPRYYSGRVEEYYADGRDKILLPYPCYRTSFSMHGGASGGPVFDSSGRVFGINSKSYETEDGNPNISFVSRITDILCIPPLRFRTGTRSRYTMTIHDFAKPGCLYFEPQLS
jgi:Trypsin-like peptidase domain